MMSITHFLKDLFPGPAARTAAVLSQECACNLQQSRRQFVSVYALNIQKRVYGDH